MLLFFQNHNQQLKGEVQRYKKRLTEAETKITDVRLDLFKIVLPAYIDLLDISHFRMSQYK